MDLSRLNEEQKQAVTHGEGPLLIVAGAGTGKTTVLTHRVGWLIDQGLAKPEEILCLTFTDKAAGEMEERIDHLLPFGYVNLWVMTFHAFAERILRQEGIAIGISPDFRVLDQTNQWMLMKTNLDRFALDYYRPLGKPTKFLSELLTHFSRAKDEGVTPQQYLSYADALADDPESEAFKEFASRLAGRKYEDEKLAQLWREEMEKIKEVAHAYAVYQQLLHEQDALDFGDLILSLRRLFQERALILEKYRHQFKFILVDEFQDTNWAQYDLIKLLASDQKNINVVGDDDQSIYKFRGASLSNILGFKSDFPEAQQVVLTHNYRSSQNILDLAYAFIQHNNPHRLEFQLSVDKELTDKAEKKQLDLAGFAPIKKELIASSQKKGIIEHLHYERLDDEAAGVVEKMLALKQEDPELTWGDFAILVRAHSSAEPFIQQLTMAEIPFQFLASQGLFSTPAVLDILSYLRLLDDYAESTALYRILILPTTNLSNEDLMALLHYAKKNAVSLREAVKHASEINVSEAGQSICRIILDHLEKHAHFARDKRVSEVAMAFIDDYGLKTYYESLDPQTQRETYGLLNQFWRHMQEFERQAEVKTTREFLAYLELVKQAGDNGALPADVEIGPETVKVMTIHGSKGLEFKHVFVVSLVDRRFPTSERKDAIPLPEAFVNEVTPGDNPHLEEERRLFYVALTRAKEGLFLTSAQDYGGARKKKLSRFLFELGFEQTEPKQTKAAAPFLAMQVKNPERLRARSMDYRPYLPKIFSYSQLKAFETCPWQYRYNYILKIPVRSTHAASFGKSMHKALEEFFKIMAQGNPKAPSKEDLLALYEEHWIDEWYANEKEKKENYEKGKEALSAFYDRHEHEWPNVIATEQAFTIQIGKYKLRGSIDRVDQGRSGLKLVDYKTGKMPKNDRSLDKHQLTLYQIAAEEVLGKEVEELTYYYLKENEGKSFIATDKQKEKLKNDIIETLDELTQSTFEETSKDKKACQNCDFRSICPYSLV